MFSSFFNKAREIQFYLFEENRENLFYNQKYSSTIYLLSTYMAKIRDVSLLCYENNLILYILLYTTNVPNFSGNMISWREKTKYYTECKLKMLFEELLILLKFDWIPQNRMTNMGIFFNISSMNRLPCILFSLRTYEHVLCIISLWYSK